MDGSVHIEAEVAAGDFLTVLSSADDPPRRMTKRILCQDDGRLGLEDYNDGYLFQFAAVPVASLADLPTILTGLDRHSCVVFGGMIPGTDASRARRLKQAQKDGTPATIEDVAHHLLPLDLEDFPAVDAEGGFDPTKEPERAVALAMSKLPAEFEGCDCVWQLTSGAGIKPGVRLRLWFWLEKKRTGAELAAWLEPHLLRPLKDGEERDPARFIDGSIFSANQPIYCAPPAIDEGITDPAPRRTGYIPCMGPVAAPAVTEQERDRIRAAAEQQPGLKAPEGVVIDSPANISRAKEWLRGLVKQGKVARQGAYGDAETWHVGAELKDLGVSEEMAVELADRIWNPHCQPEWSRKGLAEKIHNGFFYSANEAGAKATREQPWDPETLARFGASMADESVDEEVPVDGMDDKPKTNPRICLMSIHDVLAMPDMVDLVEGLLVDRENVAIVAEPKAGKTYLALEIGLSIAAQIPVLGKYAVKRQGCVIYLSGEGHIGMKRRIRAWGRLRGKMLTDAELEAMPFHYNKGVPLAQDSLAEAKAFISAVKAKVEAAGGEVVLVVIDTMARSLGGLNENESSTAAQYLELTETLRDGLDCTVLTLAHATNKTPARTAGDVDFRGSSGYSGGFDSVWTLKKYEATKTVELTGKWFKDVDLDDRQSIYFKLVKHVDLGAVLELTSPPISQQESEQQSRAMSIRVILGTGRHYGFNSGLSDIDLLNKLMEDKPDEGDVEATRQWRTKYEKEKKSLQNAHTAKWAAKLCSKQVASGGTELQWRWHLPELAPGEKLDQSGY